MNYPNKFVG